MRNKESSEERQGESWHPKKRFSWRGLRGHWLGDWETGKWSMEFETTSVVLSPGTTQMGWYLLYIVVICDFFSIFLQHFQLFRSRPKKETDLTYPDWGIPIVKQQQHRALKKDAKPILLTFQAGLTYQWRKIVSSWKKKWEVRKYREWDNT